MQDSSIADRLEFSSLVIDLSRHEAILEGKTLSLKPKEFDLLLYFAQHHGQALSREQSMDRVWGWDFTGGSRTVDVHIRWLREKLKKIQQIRSELLRSGEPDTGLRVEMNLHIRWRIALPYIFLILFIMTTTAVFLAYNFRQQSLLKLQEKVTTEASLLAEELSYYPGNVDIVNDDFDYSADTWSEIINARITIIAPDGTVVGESQADRFEMDNHLDRPEVQEALAKAWEGVSATAGQRARNLCIPLFL